MSTGMNMCLWVCVYGWEWGRGKCLKSGEPRRKHNQVSWSWIGYNGTKFTAGEEKLVGGPGIKSFKSEIGALP